MSCISLSLVIDGSSSPTAAWLLLWESPNTGNQNGGHVPVFLYCVMSHLSHMVEGHAVQLGEHKLLMCLFRLNFDLLKQNQKRKQKLMWSFIKNFHQKFIKSEKRQKKKLCTPFVLFLAFVLSLAFSFTYLINLVTYIQSVPWHEVTFSESWGVGWGEKSYIYYVTDDNK